MFQLHSPKKGLWRTTAVLAMSAAVLALTSGVSTAQTTEQVQALAQAARLELLGESVVDTGFVTASNDGSGEETSGDNTPGLTLLGDQDLLAAGVLAQDATATDDLPGTPEDDRTAAACAGAVGDGGIIAIGPERDCTATIGTPAGVVLDLTELDLNDLLGDGSGGIGLGDLLDDLLDDLVDEGILDDTGILDLGTLTADAIYAECTADADGTTTGRSTLLDAELNGLLGGGALPEDPAPNTDVDLDLLLDLDVDLAPLVELVLNEQTSTGPGQIGVTALRLTVLGDVGDDPLIDLRIGTVACGAFPPIPAIPAEGMPIAAGGFALAIFGGVAWLVARNRRSSGGPAAG